MEHLYHATAKANERSIRRKGILPGSDGNIYLTETAEDALKFVALRWEVSKFIVLEVDAEKLDMELVQESFDHSKTFFNCDAWMYPKKIPTEAIIRHTEYERGK